jgi:hypothetical protein
MTRGTQDGTRSWLLSVPPLLTCRPELPVTLLFWLSALLRSAGLAGIAHLVTVGWWHDQAALATWGSAVHGQHLAVSTVDALRSGLPYLPPSRRCQVNLAMKVVMIVLNPIKWHSRSRPIPWRIKSSRGRCCEICAIKLNLDADCKSLMAHSRPNYLRLIGPRPQVAFLDFDTFVTDSLMAGDPEAGGEAILPSVLSAADALGFEHLILSATCNASVAEARRQMVLLSLDVRVESLPSLPSPLGICVRDVEEGKRLRRYSNGVGHFWRISDWDPSAVTPPLSWRGQAECEAIEAGRGGTGARGLARKFVGSSQVTVVTILCLKGGRRGAGDEQVGLLEGLLFSLILTSSSDLDVWVVVNPEARSVVVGLAR